MRPLSACVLALVLANPEVNALPALSGPTGGLSRAWVVVHAGAPFVCWDDADPSCFRDLGLDPTAGPWHATFEGLERLILVDGDGRAYEIARGSSAAQELPGFDGTALPRIVRARCDAGGRTPARQSGAFAFVATPACARPQRSICPGIRVRRPTGFAATVAVELQHRRDHAHRSVPAWRDDEAVVVLVVLEIGLRPASTLAHAFTRRQLARPRPIAPRPAPRPGPFAAAEAEALERIDACGGAS